MQTTTHEHKLLTAQEKQFITLLKQCNKNSLWGIAISNVLNEPTTAKYLRLISDLKSQANDSPVVMKNILGNQAFKLLMQL